MKFTRAHSTAVTNSQTLQIQFQTHDPQKFPHAYLLSLPSPGRFPGHCYLLCPYTFASLEVSHNHSTQSRGRAGHMSVARAVAGHHPTGWAYCAAGSLRVLSFGLF